MKGDRLEPMGVSSAGPGGPTRSRVTGGKATLAGVSSAGPGGSAPSRVTGGKATLAGVSQTQGLADMAHRSTLSHRHLMEQYIDGDQNAFATLYRELAPKVRHRISRILRDPELVEDLTQQTFMRAHLARDRFEAAPEGADSSVDARYLAMARNVSLDHLRHVYREDRRHASMVAKGDVAGLGIANEPQTAEDRKLQDEQERSRARWVRSAIEQLPPTQREVVQLHKLRGMSMTEIAERLGVKPGALRVRAHRAYKRLGDLLEQTDAVAVAGTR